MDNVNVPTCLPRLRFNKEGNLLAVTTVDNGFKILVNATGLRSLRAVKTPSYAAFKPPIESAAIKVLGPSAVASVSPVNCKSERSSPVRPSAIIVGLPYNFDSDFYFVLATLNSFMLVVDLHL